MRIIDRQLHGISRVLLAVVVSCTLSPPVVGQSDGSATATGQSLWPGDAIRLAFWREPELNGEYGVDENGLITLPIIGTRRVTGIPAGDVLVELHELYGRELANQQVEITLLRRVRILGAVNTPGLYHLDPTMTIADALALAGGTTRVGKLDGVRILREGQVLRSKFGAGDVVFEQIRSGDQILVPERSWLSRNSTVVVGGLISAAAIIVARAAFTSN